MATIEKNWIGVLPAGWQLLRLGSVFATRNEKVSDKDFAPLSVSRGGVVPQMEGVAKSDASNDRKLVLAGDFAINSRSDRKQSCGLAEMDGSVSLINIIMYPQLEGVVFPKYLNYLLKNYGFAEEFYRWGHGIVADLWTTRWQEMKGILLPIPPYRVQEKIYQYLAQKIQQIDSLIAVEEAQIERLKEYRQSLIEKAVWRKDSPLIKLKHAYLTITEKYDGGSFPYIALENIESMSGKYIYSEATAGYLLDGSIRVEQGDVIFGKLRPYLAKTLVVEESSCVSAEFAVFRSNVNLPEYLKYLFLSPKFIDLINSSTAGTKMPRANIDFINNLRIPLPSRIKQEEIVESLDKKSEEIEQIISVKKTKIERLVEYKKSLIYEYVTGKKEALV